MTIVREVRLAVFARDGGCIAPIVDPEAGPCYDAWGRVLRPLHAPTSTVVFPRRLWSDYEMDYVRLGATGKRHELVTDHVTVCPGHHRGVGPSAGYQWATAHRREEREYLEAQHASQEALSDELRPD